MKLANQDKVQALDSEFGRMATEVGVHAWSLPQLMREKTFVFLAADLCTGNLGFPLLTHVQMAGANGVTVPECVAAIRHLAPYVGFPTAAVALQQLQLDPSGEADGAEPGDRHEVPREVADALAGLHANTSPSSSPTGSTSAGTPVTCRRGSGRLPAWPPTSSIRPWTNPSAARGSRDRSRRGPRTDQRGASAGGRVRDREGVAGLPGPSNSPAFRCSTAARSSSLSPE